MDCPGCRHRWPMDVKDGRPYHTVPRALWDFFDDTFYCEEKTVPIFARDEKKRYAPAPEGLHQAVCVDVIDKGIMDGAFGPKQKVEFVWQLEEQDETGRRFQVRRWYTLSLNEKAALRKHLENWRGKKFTQAEVDGGFDLESMIGANCQLQVVHTMSDKGGVFANVDAVVPVGKNATKMRPQDYTRKGAEPQPQADDDKVPF